LSNRNRVGAAALVVDEFERGISWNAGNLWIEAFLEGWRIGGLFGGDHCGISARILFFRIGAELLFLPFGIGVGIISVAGFSCP
jgi:hypothetical protein